MLVIFDHNNWLKRDLIISYSKVKVFSYQIPVNANSIIKRGRSLLKMLEMNGDWLADPGLANWADGAIDGGRNDARIDNL